MSRHPRILFPGAIYHVTARGNRRASIFADDKDHFVWQDTLAEVVARFHIVVHAFCLMPNHFHIAVETPLGNLPQAMHLLNGSYARRYNQRHAVSGHLAQGRYHAVLIERDAQLLEVARYIALNPVRAGLASSANEWRWSSHRYMCQQAPAPGWLTTEWILGCFAGETLALKAKAYAAFVAAGIDSRDPIARHLERNNCRVAVQGPPRSLREYALGAGTRELAMARAFASGIYSREQIATFFNVSARTVSRAISSQNISNVQPVSTFVTDPEVDTSPAIRASTSVGIKARKAV